MRINSQKPMLFLAVSAVFFFFFFFFWLCWVFVAVRRLSLVVASAGLLFVVVRGLLIAVASLFAEHRLYVLRLQ